MAFVVVTFGRSTGSLPLEQAGARTEELTAEGATETPTQSSIFAERHENVVTVHTDGDVWISIGSPNNDALLESVQGSGNNPRNRRFLPANTSRQFEVVHGDGVAVIEA